MSKSTKNWKRNPNNILYKVLKIKMSILSYFMPATVISVKHFAVCSFVSKLGGFNVQIGKKNRNNGIKLWKWKLEKGLHPSVIKSIMTWNAKISWIQMAFITFCLATDFSIDTLVRAAVILDWCLYVTFISLASTLALLDPIIKQTETIAYAWWLVPFFGPIIQWIHIYQTWEAIVL